MSSLIRTGPARAFVVALLLCVLAVRVIVPQGFMWSSGADGSPQMVLCSGFTSMQGLTPLAATALAAQHHSDQRDHDGKTGDHPCAFATAGAAVDLVAESHPLAARTLATAAPSALYLFLRPGLGLAAPPPPKTGPPAFA